MVCAALTSTVVNFQGLLFKIYYRKLCELNIAALELCNENYNVFITSYVEVMFP